jgi:hypothetical protein
VVVVAACHEQPMHVGDERLIDGPIGRERRAPSVGGDSCSGLLLRSRLELRRGLAHGGVEFLLGELGALDARRARDLTLQLQPLELVRPTLLIRNLDQGQHGRLGARELREDRLQIVSNPAMLGGLVTDNHATIRAGLISAINDLI